MKRVVFIFIGILISFLMTACSQDGVENDGFYYESASGYKMLMPSVETVYTTGLVSLNKAAPTYTYNALFDKKTSYSMKFDPINDVSINDLKKLILKGEHGQITIFKLNDQLPKNTWLIENEGPYDGNSTAYFFENIGFEYYHLYKTEKDKERTKLSADELPFELGKYAMIVDWSTPKDKRQEKPKGLYFLNIKN